MDTANAISALIHDRLGQTLRDVLAGAATGNPGDMFHIKPTETLLGQLEKAGDDPPSVTLGFALDIIGGSVSALPGVPGQNLPDPRELVRRVRGFLDERLVFFGRLKEDLGNLVDAGDPTSIGNAAETLFRRIDEGIAKTGGAQDKVFPTLGQWTRLRPFIGGDVGTVLPLVTILNAVQGNVQNAVQVPQSVERGLLAYFFRTNGYRTVDGSEVVAPVHMSDIKGVVSSSGLGLLSDPAAGLQQLRGLFSKTTAEHYIRDTIRIIVESGYDAARGLGGLYQDTTAKLRARKSETAQQDAIEKKFVAWFRGFSSMAESAAMRGVEVATQGVSQFQTNPLIGAAAGSFAGTVARKLAQDSFLGVLRTELAGK